MDCFVLLVEDDPDVRESLRLGLALDGYDVRTAANGSDALATLAQGGAAPCLILLDIMMPVMDGFEFLRRKSQDPSLASIPTVVLSAHPRDDRVLRDAGIRQWLRKPLDLDDVTVAVRRWCGEPPYRHAPDTLRGDGPRQQTPTNGHSVHGGNEPPRGRSTDGQRSNPL